MSAAGYSATPLARKLGIKRGQRVGTFAELPDLLAPLPDGVTMVRSPRRLCVVTMVFATTLSNLEDRFGRAMRVLPAEGGLWVAWPKKSSGVVTDITFEAAQTLGLAAGLVDNKVCAIDETWSGLRFVVPRATRPDWAPP